MLHYHFYTMTCVWIVAQSCRLFATLWLLCPRNSPGKTTGVGCNFLLQGIFQTQGSPALQPNSLALSQKGSPPSHKLSSTSLMPDSPNRKTKQLLIGTPPMPAIRLAAESNGEPENTHHATQPRPPRHYLSTQQPYQRCRNTPLRATLPLAVLVPSPPRLEANDGNTGKSAGKRTHDSRDPRDPEAPAAGSGHRWRTVAVAALKSRQ